jgi:hypothetical protein
MGDDGMPGPVNRSVKGLTGFLLAVAALIAAMTAVMTNWKKFESVSSGAARESTPPAACSTADGKAAWDDSNNCYLAYKNGEIAHAEAACNRGLVEAKCAKRTDVEGMIYFNLGLCAESRADWKSAQQLYESSLQVRPGNAAVNDRLTAVTGRLASNR